MNKKLLFIFGLIVISLLIFGLGINANRYYLIQQDKDLLRIDKWTGKTWIKTKYGFVEMPTRTAEELKKKIDENRPVNFPINMLQITDTSSAEWIPYTLNLKIATRIKNTDMSLSASNVTLRYIFTSDKSGENIVDTRDYTSSDTLEAQTTKTVKATLFDMSKGWNWFTVSVVSANQIN